MNKRKLLSKLLSGSKNIRFGDMITLVQGFGFKIARIRGSHHICIHPDVDEPLNLQEVHGQVKPYQIRQFLKLVERYNLRLED